MRISFPPPAIGGVLWAGFWLSTISPSLALASAELPPLKDGQGYVALFVHDDNCIKNVQFSSEKLFGTGLRLDKPDLNHLVIRAVDAGTYRWSRIEIDRTTFYSLSSNEMLVDVEAGVLNYAGSLVFDSTGNCNRAHIITVDRVTEVLNGLNKDFPSLLKTTHLRFRGPHPDPFVDFYFKDAGVTP